MNSKSNSNSRNMACQRSFAHKNTLFVGYELTGFTTFNAASNTTRRGLAGHHLVILASPGGNADLLMVTSCPNMSEKVTNLLHIWSFPLIPVIFVHQCTISKFHYHSSKSISGFLLGLSKYPSLANGKTSNEPPWHPGRHWAAAEQQAFIWRPVVGEFVLGTG